MIKKVGTSCEGSNVIEQIVMDRIMFWKGVRECHKKPSDEEKNEFNFESGIRFSIRNITNDINKFCEQHAQGIRVVIEKV